MSYSVPSTVDSINVPHLRPRRDGPEADVQDIVAGQISGLFSPGPNSWTAASVPLGAGVPDLVLVSYFPQVFALANVDLTDTQILAYLRAVGKARLETIAERVGTCPKKLNRRLCSLVNAEAIETSSNIYSLSPHLRQILPEIITIEVKVSNWRKAIEQAARNRIFSHLSFVAMPEQVARRVRDESVLFELGIGLISVSKDETATIIRKPRRRCPIVWTYYYQLAAMIARSPQN